MKKPKACLSVLKLCAWTDVKVKVRPKEEWFEASHANFRYRYAPQLHLVELANRGDLR